MGFCDESYSSQKLGTIVVLDRLSKPIDFGFKRLSVRIRVRVMFVVY